MTIQDQIRNYMDSKDITGYQLWKNLWPEFPSPNAIYTFLNQGRGMSIRRVNLIMNELNLIVVEGKVKEKDEQ